MATDALDPFGTSLVKKFIEKPDLGKAGQMLTAGNYLWNAGIFLFSSQDMIDMFKVHTPETFDLVQQLIMLFLIWDFCDLLHNLGRCSRILASIML